MCDDDAVRLENRNRIERRKKIVTMTRSLQPAFDEYEGRNANNTILKTI